MRQVSKIFIYLMLLSLLVGCQPANLNVNYIDFTETYRNEIIDLPNGTYMPDNPYFDINKPETWTGNMAKYVNHNYMYSVSYQIRNSGGTIAYDTEIDVHYTFDNGNEKTETIYIGDVEPDESISNSINIGCTNKQLISCSCEVFWFD